MADSTMMGVLPDTFFVVDETDKIVGMIDLIF